MGKRLSISDPNGEIKRYIEEVKALLEEQTGATLKDAEAIRVAMRFYLKEQEQRTHYYTQLQETNHEHHVYRTSS